MCWAEKENNILCVLASSHEERGEILTDRNDVDRDKVLVSVTATSSVCTTQISSIVMQVSPSKGSVVQTKTVIPVGVSAASDCHGAL